MGGMAIRNMGVVALTAFACSFAASLRHMAVIFPELITLGPQGGFLQLTQSIPSEISVQLGLHLKFLRCPMMNLFQPCVGEIR